MRGVKRFGMLFIVVLVALVAVQLVATSATAGDSELAKHMKTVGKSMKALKALVAKGELAGVKENAETIATGVEFAKTLEPPIHKERKAEMPPMADESVAKAKALAVVTDAAQLKASFDALGMSCKKCHDIFQPEE